jgi:hypothetical protein
MFLAALQPKTTTLQKVKNGAGDRDRTGDLLFTNPCFQRVRFPNIIVESI